MRSFAMKSRTDLRVFSLRVRYLVVYVSVFSSR